MKKTAAVAATPQAHTLQELKTARVLERLWQKDAGLWSSDAAVQASIRNRLGWLSIAETMQGRLAEIRAKTPTGRLASPEDVADVVAFLASAQARAIQGQVLVVDGGYSLLA